MHQEDKYMQAGRVSNEIELDSFTEKYKRRIFDLITLLRNNVAVFDFDGTLTEAHYTQDRILPCRDDDIQEYCKTHNLYENVRIPETMQYIINGLDPEKVYILTVSQESVEQNKLEAIHKGFPTIKDSHVIQVPDSAFKMLALEIIKSKHNQNIVFVEDTLKTLLTAEETFDFVKGVHISSLLV